MLAGKIGYFRASLDPAAAAYIAAVEAADGQALEAAVRTAINNFVVGCKSDGIWSAIKASCILCGARTLSGSLVPLVGAAPTNNSFVSADYNRKTGLVGNGTTKWLNSNRNNNADGQNDQHVAVYASTVNSTGSNRSYIGAGLGDNGSTQVVSGGGAMFYRSRSSTTSASITSIGLNTGLHAITRSVSTSFSYVAGGASGSVTLTSQTPLSQNIAVFGRNLTANTDGRLAFYSIGSNLSLSLLSSRVTALYNAIGAAIP
jgi:hypothetical protein